MAMATARLARSTQRWQACYKLDVVRKTAFSASTAMSVYVKGQHPADPASSHQFEEDLSALTANGKWTTCLDGKGIERTFKFKGFKSAWEFMNAVAAECKKQKHHPEWSNIYNQTRIRWTTHSADGLTELDTKMAVFCDEAARSFGEVEAPKQQLPEQEWEEGARECCSRPQKVQ